MFRVKTFKDQVMINEIGTCGCVNLVRQFPWKDKNLNLLSVSSILQASISKRMSDNIAWKRKAVD